MIGDYYFGSSGEDVALLTYIAETAAACHAPFVAAAGSDMFEYKSFESFAEGRPVAAGFDSPSYAAWNGFRDSDESRYVSLTLPSTLSRLPYGATGGKAKSFDYHELATDSEGNQRPADNSELVWSNAAYEMALKMNDAFTAFGWCTAIRGLENGGKSAVNITAAALSPLNPSIELVIPNRATSDCKDCNVIPVLPSPVPAKPTTIP